MTTQNNQSKITVVRTEPEPQTAPSIRAYDIPVGTYFIGVLPNSKLRLLVRTYAGIYDPEFPNRTWSDSLGFMITDYKPVDVEIRYTEKS